MLGFRLVIQRVDVLQNRNRSFVTNRIIHMEEPTDSMQWNLCIRDKLGQGNLSTVEWLSTL